MARLISSKGTKLARKYHLGIPDKKISFISSRRLNAPNWIPSVKAALALFLGICCSGVGLYLIINTISMPGALQIWPWLLTACIPFVFGYILHIMGKKRLVFLNLLAASLSICIVTLYINLFQGWHPLVKPGIHLLDGFLLQVLAVFLFWRCYQTLKQPLAMLLCTEGCIIIYHWKHIRVFHWDSITSVWNTPLNTRFVCKNGKKLTISYHWPNAIIARDIVSGKVLRHIRLQATEIFEAGAMVHFGDCTLSQKGISDGVQTFSWNNIHECEYMDNEVALIGKDMSCLAHFSTTKLPNVAVFVALVNTIAHDHITTSYMLL